MLELMVGLAEEINAAIDSAAPSEGALDSG